MHDFSSDLRDDDIEFDPEQDSEKDIYKRLSPSGFYGSRGKKLDASRAFYGTRGKRGHLYFPSGKRIDPNTFFGARGKRAGETEPLDQSEAIQYNIERYLSQLLAQQGTSVEDLEDPSVVEEKAIMEGGNREELKDKEMLLKLVNYFLSHRSPQMHTGKALFMFISLHN